MYGYYHSLKQKPQSNNIVWGLTFIQLVALGVGVKLSLMLAEIIPPLPINNITLSHIHHLIPLGISMSLVFMKQSKTGLPLPKYLFSLAKYRLYRRKVYVWRKK
ncbi:hypothetical protein N752_01030 [Desulforamulus aquiferis]|nr:hypothetical protein [Desulforamulus aquiferis]RYD07198.1 hypothetical protein N752_01030 [Desulforamulus aquiferis]